MKDAPLYFSSSWLLYFEQKDPIKVQVLRFLSALAKMFQIPFVIFERTIQFSFKFCINIQCY